MRAAVAAHRSHNYYVLWEAISALVAVFNGLGQFSIAADLAENAACEVKFSMRLASHVFEAADFK